MQIKDLIKKKKGQLGLNMAKGFVVALLSLVIVAIVSLIVMNQLGSTSLIKTSNSSGSFEYGIINNTTLAVSTFFTNVPTWFALVSIVIIILIISVVVSVVNRFGGGKGGSPESV